MSISRLCECIASEPTLIPPRCEIILFLRNSEPPEPHESTYDLFPAFFGVQNSTQNIFCKISFLILSLSKPIPTEYSKYLIGEIDFSPSPPLTKGGIYSAFFGIGFSSQLLIVQNFSMTYAS